MKQKSGPDKTPAERVLKDIRRQTRRQYSAEEKIRIVLEGLRGEENISELCRREGIAASMYYGWSKEFLEDLMTLRDKQAAQVMGAAARFHRNYTGRKFRHIFDQRLPAHRSTNDYSTGRRALGLYLVGWQRCMQQTEPVISLNY